MKRTEFSETQLQDIISRYENGEAVSNIRKDYNVTHKVINRVLKENNVMIRGNRKHFYNEDVFKEIDTAEKAYWIGFITADGYVNEDRNFMRIKLQEKDKNHLYKFMKFINGDESMIKYEFHNTTGNRQWYIEVNGKTFIKSLVDLGIRQGKSTKEKWCDKIPEEYIKDYIRGVIDGDGHIELARIDICNSYEVLKNIQDHLIDKCNIHKGKVCNHSGTNRIYIIKNRKQVLEYLYYDDCISLDRKYEIAKFVVNIYGK